MHLTSGNAESFVNKIIKGGSITGKFVDKLNPCMDEVKPLTEDNIYSDGSYDPNYYCPANFLGSQESNVNGYSYFFMKPKPQEFAMIVWTVYDYDNDALYISEQNGHGFFGGFDYDLSMNEDQEFEFEDGVGYSNFKAIIRKVQLPPAAAPRKAQTPKTDVKSTEYKVYPLNLTSELITGVSNINAGKTVESVKYVNLAGMVSDKPMEGVNIVVTRYTDGSVTTAKVLR